ncbi:hypothetical protein MUU72_23775 [Streptomyces sp. RS10V-4]|uniref:hypothetical protein n=1 Tax=Streptomyces rhizoryzae TaxID=2932493 RepID=UPI002005906B|nr:hypothetical protein [Streptomyces rhizoryzae]MCK7626088.1 hypothetical protein [Streptomyces rhizoryzae]
MTAARAPGPLPLERSRRPPVRGCADRSGPRRHLAGAPAAAVARRLVVLGWLVREAPDRRVATVAGPGAAGLRRPCGPACEHAGHGPG